MKKQMTRAIVLLLFVTLVAGTPGIGETVHARSACSGSGTSADFQMKSTQTREASRIVQSGTCGDALDWELTDDGTLTIFGGGDMIDYDKEKGHLAPWQKYSDQITKVDIKKGVASIGDCAFYCCENMVEVAIPHTVDKIGDSAFFSCRSLKSVTIHENMDGEIWSFAFFGCESLESITIPKKLKSIDLAAFYRCSNLRKIEVLNPRCRFYGGQFGIIEDESKAAFYSYAGSTAYRYAKSEGRTFVLIGEKGTQHLSASPNPLKLYMGGSSKALKISNDAITTYAYKSQNPKVAKVDAAGKVTPVAKGSTAITIQGAADVAFKEATKTVKVIVYGKPARVKGVKAVPTKKRTLKVSWKKVPSVKGYNVRYSYQKNMKKAKTIRVSSTKATIKNLTSRKQVYVQVQAYHKDGKKYIKGAWSKAMKSKGKVK